MIRDFLMNIEEFNICVDNFSDKVYRFILKNVRDKEIAQDIIQDSFEKMWLNHKNISFENSKSYLFSTAYHTMIDYIRRNHVKEDLKNVESEIYENVFYSDLKEILDKALNLLPDAQKAVILLRDYEGYSYEEIGEITGLTESQVKVYIYRARVFLKQYIVKMDIVI